MKKRKHRRITEFYIGITIMVLGIIIQIASGQFFSINNLCDLLRSFTVPAMFAVGIQMVIISGGMDLSGPSIASLSMYATVKLLLHINYEGNVLLAYGIGAGIGLLLGAVNGILIGKFDFPPMIVTLGTSTLFQGIMYGPLQASESTLPRTMYAHGEQTLLTVTDASSGLRSSLPIAFLFLIFLLAAAFLIMRYTMIGRGIYALGGDRIGTVRAGFNVFWIQMFIYCFVGMTAGVIGITRACMMLNCMPSNLLGMEMTVIAAVVLGGTAITGGYGTLTGAMLGMLLMTIVENSL